MREEAKKPHFGYANGTGEREKMHTLYKPGVPGGRNMTVGTARGRLRTRRSAGEREWLFLPGTRSRETAAMSVWPPVLVLSGVTREPAGAKGKDLGTREKRLICR